MRLLCLCFGSASSPPSQPSPFDCHHPSRPSCLVQSVRTLAERRLRGERDPNLISSGLTFGPDPILADPTRSLRPSHTLSSVRAPIRVRLGSTRFNSGRTVGLTFVSSTSAAVVRYAHMRRVACQARQGTVSEDTSRNNTRAVDSTRA